MLVKGVQCYELLGGIALKNRAFCCCCMVCFLVASLLVVWSAC